MGALNRGNTVELALAWVKGSKAMEGGVFSPIQVENVLSYPGEVGRVKDSIDSFFCSKLSQIKIKTIKEIHGSGIFIRHILYSR